MRTYHVYSDGPEGLAILRAIDDAMAVEVATRAGGLVRIMEIWERERLVARIPDRHPGPQGAAPARPPPVLTL